MFPYTEEEWLWISAKRTLQGEISWLGNLKEKLSKKIKKLRGLLGL